MSSFILRCLVSASAASLLIGCASAEHHEQAPEPISVTGTAGTALTVTPLETFDSAWAMTYLPDGRSLVSEKDGNLWLLGADGKKLGEIANVPSVTARGQGGLRARSRRGRDAEALGRCSWDRPAGAGVGRFSREHPQGQDWAVRPICGNV